MGTTVELIDTEAQQQAEQASQMLARYDGFAVATVEDYQGAGGELKRIKSLAKIIDDKRKAMTRPLDESKKAIMDFFRGPLDALTKAEGLIKGAMLSYDREQERQRREEEERQRELQRKEAERLAKLAEKAEARGDEAKAEAFQERASVVAQAPVFVQKAMPVVQGVQRRKVWKYRVVDSAQVPREYMLINDQMLNSLAKSAKGTIHVPGVEFYEEEILAAGR